MIKFETKYKGYRFRSRLEARWAVFFDAMGIKYKYEEYGFEESVGVDGDEKYRWLPDFYLPDSATWVEVKGGRPSAKDIEKMYWLLDYGSPLYLFDDSEICDGNISSPAFKIDEYRELGGNGYNLCRGLLLLGEIPFVDHGLVLHPLITHYKGLTRCYAEFLGGSHLAKKSESEIRLINCFTGSQLKEDCSYDFPDSVNFFTPDYHYYPTKLAATEVCKAYQKARSARFEHGEKG